MTKEQWKKEFSDNLKYYIKEQNMTQAQLARYTGLSVSRISDYINMTATPNVFSLMAIASAFGIKVTDLANFDEFVE